MTLAADIVRPVEPPPFAVPEDWSARCEPDFEAKWLTYLLSRFGAWCHPTDVWPVWDAWRGTVLRKRAYEVVQAARRLGLAIESSPTMGYRVVGHEGLPKHLHLHPRSDEGYAEPCEGQLVFTERGTS